MIEKDVFRTPLLRKLHPLDEKLYFENFTLEEKTEIPFLTLIGENWKAGFTVALVNLPLCVALTVASGATPSMGILSGIVGGMISGIIGGSQFNIVGPTGALSGFLMTCVIKYGLSSLPFFAIVTGIYTILIRIYDLANYIDLFPLAVIEGFTLGVALIIFLNQINPALGINIKPSEQLTNTTLTTSPPVENTIIDKLFSTFEHIDQLDSSCLLIFSFFFFALFFLSKRFSKVPWQVFAALIGISIGYLNMFSFQTLGSKFGNFKLNFYDFEYMHNPGIKFLFDPRLWVDCVPIAFISVLETLISAKVANSMTDTRFDEKLELNALSVSNMITGFLGGLPITAALARTSLNIRSGATNRVSSLINGIILFIISFLFIGMFRYLPMCVAAAQVSIVALRMVNFHEMQLLYEKDKKNFAIFMFTAAVCVVKDPTIGIIFGMLIYLMSFCRSIKAPWSEIISTNEIKPKRKNSLKKSKKHELQVTTDVIIGENINNNFLYENLNMVVNDLPQEDSEYILYRIVGTINFMNLEEHIKKIKILLNSQKAIFVISLKYLHYIDYEAICAIRHMLETITERGESNMYTSKILFTGLSHDKMEAFENKQWIIDLQNKNSLTYKDD